MTTHPDVKPEMSIRRLVWNIFEYFVDPECKFKSKEAKAGVGPKVVEPALTHRP